MWLKGVQKGGGNPLTALLWVIAQFLRCAVALRNYFYDRHFFSRTTLPIPVISVGNIVAGGVGKTPFVSMLLEDLKSPVGVLSRGYGSKNKGPSRMVFGPNDGDEAFMLAKRNQNGIVFVGKNRIQSGLYAIEKGVTCIILDDGMQYRKLNRDVEIAVVHADNPFGHGHFLPRGMLRDSPKRLKQASLVVVHGAPSEKRYQEIEKKIRQITPAPIIGTKYEIDEKESLRGGKIGAFCGIGSPEPFYQMLEASGFEIIARKTLADHEVFSNAQEFIADCLQKGASEVICTEKDYVKLPPLPHLKPLKVHMKVQFGSSHYENILNQIKTLITANIEEQA